jgi:hypothetical protein
MNIALKNILYLSYPFNIILNKINNNINTLYNIIIFKINII